MFVREEVPDSNIGSETIYLDLDFIVFLTPFKQMPAQWPKFGPRQFQLYYSVILLFDATLFELVALLLNKH